MSRGRPQARKAPFNPKEYEKFGVSSEEVMEIK